MNPQRIDVHHHFLPPDLLAELKRSGAKWTGGPPVPEWSPAIAREMSCYPILWTVDARLG